MVVFSRLAAIFAVITVMTFAFAAQASGPHEGLDCLGCHDPHYAKTQKLFKVNNNLYPNPRTGKAIDGVSGMCLGCHNLPEYGGAGVRPIYLHMTHPVNIQPNVRIATVPAAMLRDGQVQCVSCHDPHPSNPNWRYLRVDTEKGNKVGQFCGVCHGAKADKAFYGGDFAKGAIKLFSSMNESVGAQTFSIQDPNFTVSNATPFYIKALGEYPNELGPAYDVVPNTDWYLDPAKHKVPQDLRDAIQAAKGAVAAPKATPPAPAAAPRPAVKPE